MKNRYWAILAIGACALAWADEPKMPVRVDSKEFQEMKQLVGTWEGTKEDTKANAAKPESVKVTYKLTAGGSTLQETLMPGTPHEMVTMYHDEGGKLTMTHYCMLGNTPHLAVTHADAKEIVFNFAPSGGIDPAKDMHMHGLTLEFKDPNHLVQRWSCYKEGKKGDDTVFNLARLKT
jgi:uncharacterized protein YndB with AHSA1/START domain